MYLGYCECVENNENKTLSELDTVQVRFDIENTENYVVMEDTTGTPLGQSEPAETNIVYLNNVVAGNDNLIIP